MYQLMAELKKEGKSIIMISEEMPELMGMSDRLIIMKDGRITKEFERSADLSDTEIRRVRLVPDGEAPASDLIGSVSPEQVLDGGGDERGPFFIAVRFADQVAEQLFVFPGKGLRHEAQLYKRTQPDGEQKIESLVHIGKAVLRCTAAVFKIDAHIVGKDTVELDVPKADLTLHPAQQILHIRKKQ